MGDFDGIDFLKSFLRLKLKLQDMNFNFIFLMKKTSGKRFLMKNSLVLLAAITLFTACDREVEPTPAYLTIEPFELLSTDPGVHGSVSQKITHADMFMFDSTENRSIQLGTFELPATIPVLNTGNFSLNVDAVIKANGNSYYLQPYPFYKRFSTPITLAPNADETVSPKTSYRDEAVFEFVEDFEHNGLLFSQDRDNDDSTAVTRTNQDVFEGEFSGLVKLDTAHPVIVAQTTDLYDIEYSSAGKVFMELNYKTDVPLEFGVVSVEDNGTEGDINFEFVVLAKPEWNKIYFDLTEIISTSPSNRFAIIFRAGIPVQDGKYTLETAEILLDNVKLVHF